MRALITGGAGFIGSHLAAHLLEMGGAVTVIDDLSTGRYSNLAGLVAQERFEFLRASVLDADALAMAMEGCEVVYHLAAAVGVNLIIEKPLTSLITNIRGTERVLEEAARRSAAVLVTSSSEIYGKNRSDRLHEDEDRILGSPLKSRWSYSEAKAVDEVLAHTYWKEVGLPTVIVRLFNTIGPGQSGAYGMVIPRFVAQALRGEPITVYGDGTQTRCFCYVGDVVSVLPRLMAHPGARGQVFNLGSEEEVSMAELAQVVRQEVGSASEIRFIPYEEAYEEGFEDMPRRVPDTTRARQLVGFRPSLNLREIVRLVVEAMKMP